MKRDLNLIAWRGTIAGGATSQALSCLTGTSYPVQQDGSLQAIAQIACNQASTNGRYVIYAGGVPISEINAGPMTVYVPFSQPLSVTYICAGTHLADLPLALTLLIERIPPGPT